MGSLNPKTPKPETLNPKPSNLNLGLFVGSQGPSGAHRRALSGHPAADAFGRGRVQGLGFRVSRGLKVRFTV